MDRGALEVNLEGAVLLGFGKEREVFIHPDNPAWVVKRAINSPHFNLAEYGNCRRLVRAGLGQWIAHVLDITPDGRLLIMERAEPFVGKLPKKIPACFRDLHRPNTGWLRGHFVMVDYQEIRRDMHTMAEVKWRKEPSSAS
jgi:hypothetical protein